MKISDTIKKLKENSNGETISIPLPSDELILKYQQDLGIIFPEDYIYFLKNAGNISFGTKELFFLGDENIGCGGLKNGIKDARTVGVMDSLLPFCCDNGDYYCFNEEDEVVFWSHNGTSNEKWSDLATWIEEVWIGES